MWNHESEWPNRQDFGTVSDDDPEVKKTVIALQADAKVTSTEQLMLVFQIVILFFDQIEEVCGTMP